MFVFDQTLVEQLYCDKGLLTKNMGSAPTHTSPVCTGVSLEAGYRWSTTAYVASHRRLLNLTFKRVVVVISSTETVRNNYESLYFIL